VRRRRNIFRNYFSAILFTLISPSFVSAQELKMSIDKDSISFNEVATITITGEAKDIASYAELPETNGVVVIGRTSSYSFNGNNGKLKISQTFTLQPIRVGRFSIGPAWVQSGGKRIFSNKVSLVIKAGSASSPSNTVFLRCEPDKNKALLGEEIILTLRLYHRVEDVRLGSDRPFAKSFNGFWYHAGPVDETYKDTLVKINGFVYIVETLYKEFVFPNATGKLKIPSYKYTCTVKQNPFPSGDDRIDDLMGIDVPVTLHSDEVPIEVFSLTDENRPANFSGDVGKFSLSAAMDRTDVKANEAIKLTVTIGGKGNISFLQLPKQTFPDDIESFPPSASDSSTISGEGVEGSKTFSITLIPKKEGKYVIPGITFSYYDPKKKEYVTLNTPEFNLNVAPGDPAKDVSENNLPNGFLDDQGNGNKVLKIFIIVVPQILLILFLILLWRRRKNRIEKENNAENKIPEPAIPVKTIDPLHVLTREVEANLIAGNYSGAAAKLYEALITACCTKCELIREEASVQQLRYRMKMKKVPPETIDEIIALLDELSLLRFGGLLDRRILFEKLEKIRFLITNL